MDDTETPGECATLVIQFDPDKGEVRVEGPIKNRLLAYGMLKLAEKAIDEHGEQERANAIVPAQNGNQRFLKRY